MKKRIIILGSVVVAVIVLWSAAWLVLAGVVKQNVDALALTDGVTEPNLTCGTLDVGGFPFRFDVDCETARIVSGDIVVDVPGIRASIRVYAPFHVLASAKGPLQLSDNFTGTRNGVAWSSLEASVRLDNWRIARASLSGKDLVWSDTLFGDAVIAQSPLTEIHLFDIPEQYDAERHVAALALYARADNLAWPGLTLTDTNAEVQLELSGLPDDVRNWGDPMLLPSMQQAGGALKIVAIHATDAASVLDAEGQLGLDEQGMVDGQIAITSTGVAERIGPLLQEPWRTLVLGTPGADGAHVNQINFRAGGIFSGLVPIASLPPLF
ncbi:DUF2125 domain-containing protein [Devosia ginsengisoli]|uniref:DUF2125 domain-containing protein n=1 Tax=Devosia ginsengisoli TaxID=400770 RepID=UPI0026F157A2|nr:DUF2125 domain-containing protein [Devosia ginsengisoli]MCR6672270.1 DUF2125 domain-containing protein [Devosia ginsengisoli]